MLTVALLAVLCSPVGCDYIDITKSMKVLSDAECVPMADFANRHNIMQDEPARFICVGAKQAALIAGK